MRTKITMKVADLVAWKVDSAELETPEEIAIVLALNTEVAQKNPGKAIKFIRVAWNSGQVVNVPRDAVIKI